VVLWAFLGEVLHDFEQAKKREWRTREIVMPHIEKLKPTLARSVLQEMQTMKVTGTKEELKAAHAKRLKQLVRP
jgi:mitochondrial inner membrane protein COX18